MNFGENIRINRKKRGLTQKQLGEKLGISQAAIGQFESNKANPKIETIRKIANALDVSLKELMPDSENRDIETQAYLESTSTDYTLIEAAAHHKIFTNKEREKIFKKIEHHRKTLVKMKDSNKLLEYSRKTHDELEDILLEMLLSKPNCEIFDVIVVVSCFLSLKKNGRDSLVEILIEHCYPDADLKYWKVDPDEPPQE